MSLSLIMTYNLFTKEEISYLTIEHCLGLYGLGVVLEFIDDRKNSFIFTRKNNHKVLHYKDIVNKDQFTFEDKIKYKVEERNGVSVTYRAVVISEEETSFYLCDYDIVYVVVKGKLKIKKADKVIYLEVGDSYKISRFVPRSIQGTKNTTLTTILIKRNER